MYKLLLNYNQPIMSYPRGRVNPLPTSVWLLLHLFSLYEHEIGEPSTILINKRTHIWCQMSQIARTADTRKYKTTAGHCWHWKVISGKLISVIYRQTPFSDCVCGYVPVKHSCLISPSHFEQILVIDLEMWANCPEIMPFTQRRLCN